jgi:hypothetical protein
MVHHQLPLAGSFSESILGPACYSLYVQDNGVGRADSSAADLTRADIVSLVVIQPVNDIANCILQSIVKHSGGRQ